MSTSQLKRPRGEIVKHENAVDEGQNLGNREEDVSLEEDDGPYHLSASERPLEGVVYLDANCEPFSLRLLRTFGA